MKGNKLNPHKDAMPKPGSGVVSDDSPMLTSLGKLSKAQINDGGAKGTPYSTGSAKGRGDLGARSSQ